MMGTVERLPVGLLDWAGRQGDRLVATFGQSLSIGVEALADGAGGYGLTVDFGQRVGDSLTGRMTGGYHAGAVTLTTDQAIGLAVSPEAFGQWMRPVAEVADLGESVGLSLPRAARVTAEVDLSAALRKSAGLRFDPERTRLSARISLPQTQLKDEWYHRELRSATG